MQKPKEMCASGGKCEGQCRELNLFRDRKEIKGGHKGLNEKKNWPCPAFYLKYPPRVRRFRDED